MSATRHALYLQTAKTCKKIRKIAIFLIYAKFEYNKTYDLLNVVGQAF